MKFGLPYIFTRTAPPILHTFVHFLSYQSFNMWIVSLASSDILFTTSTFITHTMGQFNYKFNYNVTIFIMVYIGAISYYSCLGLNIDRAYAIKYPLQA